MDDPVEGAGEGAGPERVDVPGLAGGGGALDTGEALVERPGDAVLQRGGTQPCRQQGSAEPGEEPAEKVHGPSVTFLAPLAPASWEGVGLPFRAGSQAPQPLSPE